MTVRAAADSALGGCVWTVHWGPIRESRRLSVVALSLLYQTSCLQRVSAHSHFVGVWEGCRVGQ